MQPLRVFACDHVCGDPGWFVLVCYKTPNGHRDGFVRRCVAHSFPSTKRREAVSLRVETYRTEVGSLMAYVITFARRSTKRYLLAIVFQKIHENITKELTALPPSAMNSRWWIHQREGFLVKSWRIYLVAPSVTSRICGPRRKSTTHFGGEKQASSPQRAQECLEVASSCTEERANNVGGKLRFAAQRPRAGGDVERHSPFPLSPCPTAAELSLSLEAGRAQLDQDEGPERHLTSTLTKPAWKHGHS